jgi:hypothetical protein
MKKALFAFSLAMFVILVFVTASEILLRLTGHAPWQAAHPFPNEPVTSEPDSVLGWRNKPGRYVFPGYFPAADSIRMTFLTDGCRMSGAAAGEVKRRIVLVGGSFMQGWALSDRQTLGWKLQERYPNCEVLNFGAAGYGTYQSLLVLERILPSLPPPVIVVYGFGGHHEDRNAATASWVELLTRFSARGHVAVPYVTLGRSGELVRHSPTRYPTLPWQERLAFSAFAAKWIMQWRARGRVGEKHAITEELLLAMERECAAHGAGLLVAVLQLGEGKRPLYEDFFAARGLRVVYCARPLTADLRVRGEGHPNEKMNALWAECIAGGIDAL